MLNSKEFEYRFSEFFAEFQKAFNKVKIAFDNPCAARYMLLTIDDHLKLLSKIAEELKVL